FWTKLEARAAALASQQETAEPCGVSRPHPDTEDKQAPILLPKANQGSTPPNQRLPAVHRVGTHHNIPYRKDLVPLSRQVSEMEALASTGAQSWMDDLTLCFPSSPPVKLCLLLRPSDYWNWMKPGRIESSGLPTTRESHEA
ncbi:Hypothetical predicted protein, partial [Pelobates cultripes]